MPSPPGPRSVAALAVIAVGVAVLREGAEVVLFPTASSSRRRLRRTPCGRHCRLVAGCSFYDVDLCRPRADSHALSIRHNEFPDRAACRRNGGAKRCLPRKCGQGGGIGANRLEQFLVAIRGQHRRRRSAIRWSVTWTGRPRCSFGVCRYACRDPGAVEAFPPQEGEPGRLRY